MFSRELNHFVTSSFFWFALISFNLMENLCFALYDTKLDQRTPELRKYGRIDDCKIANRIKRMKSY